MWGEHRRYARFDERFAFERAQCRTNSTQEIILHVGCTCATCGRRWSDGPNANAHWWVHLPLPVRCWSPLPRTFSLSTCNKPVHCHGLSAHCWWPKMYTGGRIAPANRCNFPLQPTTWKCALALHRVDRVIPNGQYTLDNVQCLCGGCNAAKCTMEDAAFKAKIAQIKSRGMPSPNPTFEPVRTVSVSSYIGHTVQVSQHGAHLHLVCRLSWVQQFCAQRSSSSRQEKGRQPGSECYAYVNAAGGH